MSRGGSRIGAGRPGWRRKCENMLSLDVRRLARKGCLTPGRAGGWRWTRDGESRGNVGYHVEADCVRLAYIWTPHGGEPVSMNYPVSLSRTPCHFGGSRLWFNCPRCGDMRAIIYGIARDGRFGCRACLRLAYASEAEGVVDRTWRKQHKIEARLMRKGIRQRTADRLMARLDECEEQRDSALAPGLARLLSRLDPEFARELQREMGAD